MRRHHFFATALVVFGLAFTANAAERDVQDFVYMGEKGPVLLRFHVLIDGKPYVDVWEEFMGKLFAYLDRDDDGALSKDEAGRSPPIVVLFSNFPRPGAQQANVAEAMDKDRDGKITRKEMADWYRQNGAAPFQFRTNVPQQGRTVVRRVAGQPQPLTADALNEKLYSFLDADKDGKLSREEMAKAPDILGKLDLDDDEMVSVLEMNGDVENRNGNAVFFQTIVQQPKNNLFVMVTPAQRGKQLARELLNHYAPKGKGKNVRKLTRQDLGMDEAAFARLDADEDGKLDSVELAYFARRSPDLEFRVRLEVKAGVKLIQNKDRPSPLAKAVRPSSDGTLLLEFGTTRIELGNGDSSAPAPPRASQDQVRQRYLMQFRAADKDNNGYLDDKEAKQSLLFRNLFRAMDRDGDGKLFAKEVVAYLKAIMELEQGAVNSCASLAIQDQGRGLFDSVDTDKDGRLGVREMRRMVELIASLDRDADGRLAVNEIPHKYRVDVRRGPDNSVRGQNVVVTRKVGATASSMAERNAGPRWFRKMDRNRDGDVSRREFLGSDAEFRRIDADGDNLISSEEAKRADEMFRKKK